MKNQTKQENIDRSKVVPLVTLQITAGLITIAGAAFMVYSLLQNVYFPVMGTQVHGALWGLVILFLGVRYLFSVQKLKKDVYKSTAQFSFSNFKRLKP
jgi:hypothetical protein